MSDRAAWASSGRRKTAPRFLEGELENTDLFPGIFFFGNSLEIMYIHLHVSRCRTGVCTGRGETGGGGFGFLQKLVAGLVLTSHGGGQFAGELNTVPWQWGSSRCAGPASRTPSPAQAHTSRKGNRAAEHPGLLAEAPEPPRGGTPEGSS